MSPAAPQRHCLVDSGPLDCERGGRLQRVEIAYTTWGQLTSARDNVVWILHPLTCSANPREWWPEMVGEGRPIDPAIHYIVCVNSLGSCYGSTGPTSIDPATGARYARGFPLITLQDVVTVHERVRRALAVERIALGIGGSYGGQQLIEWMTSAPSLFEHACVIGAGLRQSPWAIAFNESQRMAMEADPGFADGNGRAGLAAARSVAVLSYRSAAVYARTQAEEDDEVCDDFRAAGYQRHVGDKFTRRFDAQSYWTLTKAMDSHNPARGRGRLEGVLAKVSTRVLFLALQDDLLFTRTELQAAAAAFPHGRMAVIESDFGHDAILTHTPKIARALRSFLGMTDDVGVAFDIRSRRIRDALPA